jgi:peroxiredoxin Q/BCP
MKTRFVGSVLALAVATSLAAQQPAAVAPAPAAAAPVTPEIGTLAPDFTLPAATRYGVLQNPVKLSDFRGKTVILAFFPKARTRGCTIQMHAYRDQYGKLFHAGQDLVLIAISGDPADTLAAWAKDDQFQFLMASDAAGPLTTAKAYGANNGRPTASRMLFVIDKDGRIAHKMVPFREVDPTSYVDLAAVLDKLAPPAADPAKGD